LKMLMQQVQIIMRFKLVIRRIIMNFEKLTTNYNNSLQERFAQMYFRHCLREYYKNAKDSKDVENINCSDFINTLSTKEEYEKFLNQSHKFIKDPKLCVAVVGISLLSGVLVGGLLSPAIFSVGPWLGLSHYLITVLTKTAISAAIFGGSFAATSALSYGCAAYLTNVVPIDYARSNIENLSIIENISKKMQEKSESLKRLSEEGNISIHLTPDGNLKCKPKSNLIQDCFLRDL
jgi:hypothetical protein